MYLQKVRTGVMLNKIIIILLYCIHNGLSQDTHYQAAVVDYKTIFDRTIIPEQNLLNNVEEYNKIITNVKKQGVDIIVFPEYGVTGTHIPQIKSYYLPYTIVIPDSNQIFCDGNENVSIVLKKLSCIAKKNQIYIVLNLAERVNNVSGNGTNNYFIYNTDIVFDRNGKLIAKYRKVNLYEEYAFDPNLDESHLVSFATDFNVVFGIMTCFDILFYDPPLRLVEENITDFIFPTAWISELPFLTALQVQSGWARTNRVNLLASNRIGYRSGGSGIFSAKEGSLNYTVSSIDDDTKVIIAKVPKINKNDPFDFDQQEDFLIENTDVPKYIPKAANMVNYTLQEITEGELNSYKLKHDTLECYFDVKIKNFNQSVSDNIFVCVAYSGLVHLGDSLNYVKICGIITCLNSSRESCGYISTDQTKFHQFEEIRIRSNVNTTDKSLTFPSVIGYDLSPIPFNHYYFNYNQIELKKPTENLITFGIYQLIYTSSAKIKSLSILIIFFAYSVKILL